MTGRLKSLNDAVAGAERHDGACGYCESPFAAPSSKRLRRYRVT